jgi:hypothetical protein
MDALFELLVYKIAHLVNQPVKIWADRVTAKQCPLKSNQFKQRPECMYSAIVDVEVALHTFRKTALYPTF